MIKFSEQFPPFNADVIIYSNGEYSIGRLVFLAPEDDLFGWGSSALIVARKNDTIILDPLYYNKANKAYTSEHMYWVSLPEVTEGVV